MLLEIYAPWCGFCQSFESTYSKIGKRLRTPSPRLAGGLCVFLASLQARGWRHFIADVSTSAGAHYSANPELGLAVAKMDGTANEVAELDGAPPAHPAPASIAAMLRSCSCYSRYVSAVDRSSSVAQSNHSRRSVSSRKVPSPQMTAS